jgi:hypothetical protein
MVLTSGLSNNKQTDTASTSIWFLKPGMNFSSHEFLLTLAHQGLLKQQTLMAFFLEHLCPFEQCFRTGFDGIAWCFEMRSGQEALTGKLVVLVSHLNLGVNC